MGYTRHPIRRKALEKLATLSAQSIANQDGGEGEGIGRLCDLQRPHGVSSQREMNGDINSGSKAIPISSVPMSVRELEVLVALCKAAPLVQATADAKRLLSQLGPYVPEAHRQSLNSSSLHQHLPPWETLSYDLTSAVLSIGLNHPSLRSDALTCIDRTIVEVSTSAEKAAWIEPQTTDDATEVELAEKSLPALQLSAALLGFFDAIAQYVQVWTVDQRTRIVERLRAILSEKFMISLEGALSAVRNARGLSRSVREWKRWVRHYATRARPLGAMLLQQAFMKVVENTASRLLFPITETSGLDLLDSLMQRKALLGEVQEKTNYEMVESLTEIAVEEINLLEADADYLSVSSAWQQRLAFEVKASSLRSFLYCSLLDEEIADEDLIIAWLDAVTVDPIQMADESLARTVLKSMAILARRSPAIAANLTRSLPRLIVQGRMPPQTAAVAGECLARILKQLPSDVIISSLYSLGNVLSSSSGEQKAAGMSPFFDGTGSTISNGSIAPYGSQHALGSAISLVGIDEEATAAVYGSVVQAIVAIAVVRHEDQMTALVISMLVQKIGRVNSGVDARIVTEMAALGVSGGANELRALLRLYARIASEATFQNHSTLIGAVTDGRLRLSAWIQKDSPLYEVYLTHLLSLFVGSGDTPGERAVDSSLIAKNMAQLFKPMAVLVSSNATYPPRFEGGDELATLSRDSWFNIVAHGFTLNSAAGKEYAQELQVLAQYSLPLIDESRVDLPESGIDLNTVLRRGANAQHTTQQKSSLLAALPQCESEIKGLGYAECVFLNTALLVSMMRARAGDCTAVLPYFMERKVKTTAMGSCMLAIALNSVDTYLQRALTGEEQAFAAPQVALQLATLFEGCCHRIPKVQHAAVSCADRIISAIPSALCQKASLFALLELLSLMWKSCLDAETDEYEWRSTYSSEKGNVTMQLSDDIEYRQSTLTNYHRRCRMWVSRAIDAAPLDVKGLLQAYLEDYEDDGAYGHIALGRSFAVEMGSAIPNTDQRLTNLDRQRDVGVNTASDFIAQYTTRQEYRHIDSKIATADDWALVGYDGGVGVVASEATILAMPEAIELRRLADKLQDHLSVPFAEIRSTLRNAAGVLSRSANDCTPLIRDLVNIPFTIFTKQSINLGISLWLGVVKENPSLESRILVEVATGWESSIRLKKGFFHASFQHLDPFYIKEEFAPSKWEVISKRLLITHNLIDPHLRLTHFLSSHFSSSRLTSPSVERIYVRLMLITMLSMRHSVSQPLAREVHFHIVLLALKVLKHSIGLDAPVQIRLKDAILSAGLSWFAHPPCWSFGSNRLQLKAEVKLLNDVHAALQTMTSTDARSNRSLTSLRAKQELLMQLLTQENGRLMIWITPLAGDARGAGLLNQGGAAVKDVSFSHLISTAWNEDPRIAIQLTKRFPNSQTLSNEVRRYLLQQPEKAIDDPDALYILLGLSLPSDVRSQLKYMLYWAPVNPMAAVTYFLPAYGNHPSIIQYAVRALESHSVDVTFFYVPQIVQALRYDGLGYVERYIVETATFSQLFAHQIIWNMKANAFKDEDSQEPDSVKPVLDKVMGSLISSFSAEDKDFYEKEFDFFGKVTGISGTLKPFIKEPKAVKKQKIEEELRKIQVEVGVYLPSNPDGVVIGIDRKAGKPLQSHAKAPYMATFRIRKEEGDIEATENQITHNGEMVKRRTYEVWQSAIFKVGDDCRQDVLALQLIAAFRGIFNNVGLDVYVFPYRVTATAPGCGVIDVLPNSISRDMLGREAVNGLYEYFISKYGSEDSIRFQEARSNFIKSMAAYSIISYLLQFKDRHNGNIMVDDAGHILHIDFGFLFDIAPGGVKFERAPFKLSAEMVAVMGGSTDSAPFHAFEELCVKAFLASRQYVEQLAHIISTMLDSGLPCFKPATIQHFKERFVLEKSDREAADFVRKLVHWSERSYSTGVYDYFQLLTNGIPY